MDNEGISPESINEFKECLVLIMEVINESIELS